MEKRNVTVEQLVFWISLLSCIFIGFAFCPRWDLNMAIFFSMFVCVFIGFALGGAVFGNILSNKILKIAEEQQKMRRLPMRI